MHSFNKSIGNCGENIAEKYMKNLGYFILEKNFRCKIGEIDIIAKDKDYIVFVEVKSRFGVMYGTPSEAVNKSKQYKIYKTAQMYILKKKLFCSNFRFDVIEVIFNSQNDTYSIRLIKDAFQIYPY
jgi:putative endonuclease